MRIHEKKRLADRVRGRENGFQSISKQELVNNCLSKQIEITNVLPHYERATRVNISFWCSGRKPYKFDESYQSERGKFVKSDSNAVEFNKSVHDRYMREYALD